MARLAAILIIGVLLLIAVVFIVSKVSDGLKGRGDTVWKVVVLVAFAGIAFWFFGRGMVFEYFNR
jgi:hypothetical protein